MKSPAASPFLLLVLLVFGTSTAHAQWWKLNKKVNGNGTVTTETRTVADFDEVSAATGLHVVFTQGPKSVKVTADENLHEYILTEVNNGKLTVKRKNNTYFKRYKTIMVYVSTPEIYGLYASSGGELETDERVSTKSMNLRASSGGSLDVDVTSETIDMDSSSGSSLKATVKAETLDASASSGSNTKISGTANKATVDVSSGANISAKELTAIDCTASASSGGGVTITVTNQLDGRASSGGSVGYWGNPSQVDKNTSSGGSVSKK